MEYLLYYFGACFLLVIGYMIGVNDERKHGPAAAQKELDKQIAEYYTTQDQWDSLDISLRELDNDVASKQIGKYSHLRLV
jgi:hypothetical protein